MTAKKKILKAIDNNRFKLQSGQRYWYGYFVVVYELVWARNNHDGYLIDVYAEEYGKHLTSITI